MTNLIVLGSSITADSDCSHEIRRYLLLGRKAMINQKQRTPMDRGAQQVTVHGAAKSWT